jgi:hypothetical protein
LRWRPVGQGRKSDDRRTDWSGPMRSRAQNSVCASAGSGSPSETSPCLMEVRSPEAVSPAVEPPIESAMSVPPVARGPGPLASSFPRRLVRARLAASVPMMCCTRFPRRSEAHHPGRRFRYVAVAERPGGAVVPSAAIKMPVRSRGIYEVCPVIEWLVPRGGRWVAESLARRRPPTRPIVPETTHPSRDILPVPATQPRGSVSPLDTGPRGCGVWGPWSVVRGPWSVVREVNPDQRDGCWLEMGALMEAGW